MLSSTQADGSVKILYRVWKSHTKTKYTDLFWASKIMAYYLKIHVRSHICKLPYIQIIYTE